MTISGAAGSISARAGAQTFLRRFGFRSVLIVSALSCGVAVAAAGWIRSDTPLIVILAVLAVGGFLRSNHLTSISALSFADIPDRQVSQASSFTAVAQQMSQALGITVAGLMLHVSQGITGPHGTPPLAPQNFILPFAAIGLCAMLAAATYLPLPANAGAHMHGREGVRGRR